MNTMSEAELPNVQGGMIQSLAPSYGPTVPDRLNEWWHYLLTHDLL